MNKETKEQILDIIETHSKMVSSFKAENIETIEKTAELIVEVLKKGGRIYICGNGGSAADAQHIAGEFVGRFQMERSALPAIALTTDTSVITAIANDYDFEQVFARQVEALVTKDDILWAISTSGMSPDIIAAVNKAKTKKAKIIAFTGRKNSTLEQLADICICAENLSTARSQEIHQLAYHIICELVEKKNFS